MKTIIAGSRNISDISIVKQAICDSGFDITEVVSGCAKGVDRLGEEWAAESGISVKQFKTKWTHRGAGFVTNKKMAEYADAAIILWDGKSKGTKHMIDTCNKIGIKLHIHIENS